MTATTTQLENTTVLLDTLYSSYSAILAEAKTQLETLDMTSRSINRVSESLATNSQFQSSIKTKAVDEMCERLRENPEDATGAEVKLIDTLATVIGNKLGQGLQEQLDAKLKEFFESGAVEKIVNDRIAANSEIISGIETKLTLKHAFALAFDLDMTGQPEAEAEAPK